MQLWQIYHISLETIPVSVSEHPGTPHLSETDANKDNIGQTSKDALQVTLYVLYPLKVSVFIDSPPNSSSCWFDHVLHLLEIDFKNPSSPLTLGNPMTSL